MNISLEYLSEKEFFMFNQNIIDDEVIDYLMQYSEKINHTHILKLSFMDRISTIDILKDRIKVSLENMYNIEMNKNKRIIKRIVLYFIFGIFIILGSVFLREYNSSIESIVYEVINEGLLILAWLLVWEATDELIDFFKYRLKLIRLYRALLSIKIEVFDNK